MSEKFRSAYFEDIKDNLVYYYPKKLTFFGLDIFFYQKDPKPSTNQVIETLKKAKNPEKEDMLWRLFTFLCFACVVVGKDPFFWCCFSLFFS